MWMRHLEGTPCLQIISPWYLLKACKLKRQVICFPTQTNGSGTWDNYMTRSTDADIQKMRGHRRYPRGTGPWSLWNPARDMFPVPWLGPDPSFWEWFSMVLVSTLSSFFYPLCHLFFFVRNAQCLKLQCFSMLPVGSGLEVHGLLFILHHLSLFLVQAESVFITAILFKALWSFYEFMWDHIRQKPYPDISWR